MPKALSIPVKVTKLSDSAYFLVIGTFLMEVFIVPGEEWRYNG